MTAKEFWNSQVPTDANKVYVSDFYATKFDHDDLARFAEAFANQEVERRIAKRIPKPKEAKEKRDNRSGSYLNPRSAMSFDTGFDYAYNWLRSCLVSQKTEGGGE